MTDSRSRSSRRPVAGALGLLLLAAVLFILATMLSLADTGDETLVRLDRPRALRRGRHRRHRAPDQAAVLALAESAVAHVARPIPRAPSTHPNPEAASPDRGFTGGTGVPSTLDTHSPRRGHRDLGERAPRHRAASSRRTLW